MIRHHQLLDDLARGNTPQAHGGDGTLGRQQSAAERRRRRAERFHVGDGDEGAAEEDSSTDDSEYEVCLDPKYMHQWCRTHAIISLVQTWMFRVWACCQYKLFGESALL